MAGGKFSGCRVAMRKETLRRSPWALTAKGFETSNEIRAACFRNIYIRSPSAERDEGPQGTQTTGTAAARGYIAGSQGAA